MQFEQLEASKYTCLLSWKGATWIRKSRVFDSAAARSSGPYHRRNRVHSQACCLFPIAVLSGCTETAAADTATSRAQKPLSIAAKCAAVSHSICFVLPGREQHEQCVGLDEVVSRTGTLGKSSARLFAVSEDTGRCPDHLRTAKAPGSASLAWPRDACLGSGRAAEQRKTIEANARPSGTCPGGRAA